MAKGAIRNIKINRKPFQGVFNIIRFNWHFYLGVVIILIALLWLSEIFIQPLHNIIIAGVVLSILTIIFSLSVSFYIYDLSDLYQLKWLSALNNKCVLNINAGFDETSEIILKRFPQTKLKICDFYDSHKHTEISIKRARRTYPPQPKTISVTTEHLPFEDNYFDKTLAILAAHEIRNDQERAKFFEELNRVTKPTGQIMVTEHLRDWRNFIAYTIGFLHFHSQKTWLETFHRAGLKVEQKTMTTPFITTFILVKDGNTF